LVEVQAPSGWREFIHHPAECDDRRDDHGLARRLETTALLDSVEAAILPSLGMLVPRAVKVKLDGNERANHQYTNGQSPLWSSQSARFHGFTGPESSHQL